MLQGLRWAASAAIAAAAVCGMTAQVIAEKPNTALQMARLEQSRSQYASLINSMQEKGMMRVHDGQGGYYDTSAGRGANYKFEVWGNRSNTNYWLIIWDYENYPNGSYRSLFEFPTAREALDYFDCRYAKKSLPTCPNN